MPLEKKDHLRPQRKSCRFTVTGAVVGKKGMAGVGKTLQRRDLVLACLLQARLQLSLMFGGGVLVFGAEHPVERAMQLLDQVEHWRGTVGSRDRVIGSASDEATPAIHRRIHLATAAGEQKRAAPAHAK